MSTPESPTRYVFVLGTGRCGSTMVEEVLADLANAGYGNVEVVKTAEEDLMFSLPKELRTDAAGNADDRALGGRQRPEDQRPEGTR